MEILTLKGNGKSKLLMQLMNQCESKRALMIIYKGQNVSKSWIPYGCICAETDDIKFMESNVEQYIKHMETVVYEPIDYIVIYSNVKTENEMRRDGVYTKLESVLNKFYMDIRKYNSPTCIVACKE
ncbi:hypothetical protein [Anaerostipes hadrus]|jgi:lysyl-tRNA synthetase class I|uniref:hypothetical protein n=1 Tax=Anaerostipes hadrus TaxID=649756 RepID=UPI001EDFEEBE|nr:hypothetical protein [Anaerostipes hadrus]MCG4624963.1 hypothetical protein [Anaerostipes hadrus]DAT25897.1 MAG TPA: YjiA protein [Caudoviricetes sp.]